jgi:transcriptional regulator with XRE-family HTH domain
VTEPEPRKKLGGPPRRLKPRSPELAALAQAIEGLTGEDPRLRALAKRSGISEKQISEFVRGQGNPTYTTLLKLAEDGLGVPLHILVLRAHELREQAKRPKGGEHDAF